MSVYLLNILVYSYLDIPLWTQAIPCGVSHVVLFVFLVPEPDATEDLLPIIDISEKDPQSVPSTTVKQDIVTPEGAITTKEGDADASKHLENNLTEVKEIEFMDAQEEDTPTEGKEFTFLSCIIYRIKQIRDPLVHTGFLLFLSCASNDPKGCKGTVIMSRCNSLYGA